MKELKDIENYLLKDGLVVIDFYGDWCGSCSMLKPTIEKLSEEYSDNVNILGCNVDECPGMVIEFGIRSVPTLIFLKDGELQNRLIGNHQEQTIRDAINLLISESKR